MRTTIPGIAPQTAPSPAPRTNPRKVVRHKKNQNSLIVSITLEGIILRINRRIRLFLEGGIRLRGSNEPPWVISRRYSLRLSGVGAVAAVLGVAGSGKLFAQVDPVYSSLVEELEEAADEYDVPMASCSPWVT